MDALLKEMQQWARDEGDQLAKIERARAELRVQLVELDKQIAVRAREIQGPP